MRILLVEPNEIDRDQIVAGLLACEPTWYVISVLGSQDALFQLELREFDAIICAHKLELTTGAHLLSRIRSDHPDLLRVLLLPANVDRNLGVNSQQFGVQLSIRKPVIPAQLSSALTRTQRLGKILGSPVLRKRIAGIKRLPAPPHAYMNIRTALSQGSASSITLAKLINQTPGIAASVLRLANSAYFSRDRPAPDLIVAITRIGIDTFEQLVLASEVFGAGAASADADRVHDQALRASRLAHRLLSDPTEREFAATAALLANVGLLLPRPMLQLAGEASEQNDFDCGLDIQSIAGAYLLSVWGLPSAIVEAVAFRDKPAIASPNSFGAIGAVHVASRLIAGEAVDEDYLESADVLDQLPHWSQMARFDARQRQSQRSGTAHTAMRSLRASTSTHAVRAASVH